MKVVVVGCGGMANAWVKLGLEHEEVELVGLVDLNRAAAEAMAERHELSADLVYDSLAEAVKATGADAVYDVTVPAAHHPVTMEALSLGCHVLGEKPLSATLQEGREMLKASQEAGKMVCVTQTRRPSGFARRTLKMIEDGVIGDIQEMHCDFFIGARFGMPGKTNFRNTMDHPLLLDMAVHTFDNARQISRADAKRVYCRSWNPRRSWYDGDASALAIFDMVDADGNDFVYSYRGSWTNEGHQTSWNADWRLVGAKGTLHTDGDKVVEAEVVNPESSEMFRDLEKHEAGPASEELGGHKWYIDQFAKAVLHGGEPPCPVSDNIKSLAMVLAAVESAETGKPVDIVD